MPAAAASMTMPLGLCLKGFCGLAWMGVTPATAGTGAAPAISAAKS
jgi:hypothetical protein